MLDFLNSKLMTDAGSLDLIEDEDDEEMYEKNRHVLFEMYRTIVSNHHGDCAFGVCPLTSSGFVAVFPIDGSIYTSDIVVRVLHLMGPLTLSVLLIYPPTFYLFRVDESLPGVRQGDMSTRKTKPTVL